MEGICVMRHHHQVIASIDKGCYLATLDMDLVAQFEIPTLHSAILS